MSTSPIHLSIFVIEIKKIIFLSLNKYFFNNYFQRLKYFTKQCGNMLNMLIITSLKIISKKKK